MGGARRRRGVDRDGSLNFFIYLFEGGAFAARVAEVRASMLARGDHLLTSALTLGELLVKPREQGEAAFRDHDTTIRQIAAILPFDAACAPRYAAIRGDRGIKAPDAIQLACAAVAGVALAALVSSFVIDVGWLWRQSQTSQEQA